MALKKAEPKKKKTAKTKPSDSADAGKKKGRRKVVKAAPEAEAEKPRGPIVTPPKGAAPVVSPPKPAKKHEPAPEPKHEVSAPVQVKPPKRKEPSERKPEKKAKPHAPPKPETKRKAELPKKPAQPEKQEVEKAAPVAVWDEKPAKKKLIYNEMMTVKDMAEAMGINVTEVIKKLLLLGSPATINQRLELEPATLVADALGYELELKSIYVDDRVEEKEPEQNLKPRPPVVTVMGHVDHGKTSLLDAIRSTRVAEKEAGGITQHIGAYQIKVEKGSITFLDTPGHEAFTAMRARGATVTDIVVLVVAADDSVMPQTVEAIDHARAANVPIVVAINKMDLPTANVEKVKRELANHNLIAEDWGGKNQMVEVSAKTNTNIDKLLEMILLEAELLELKANPDKPARGSVLEAKLDPKRGVTASLLIQSGTLRQGDVVVCGLSPGRVRAMFNDNRQPMESAGPALPIEILGLNKVPHVGDQLSVVRNDREAREIAEKRSLNLKDQKMLRGKHVSLESLHSRIEGGQIQELNVILKADVQGSLQAIQDAMGRITTKLVTIRFIHTGVGNINDSDVLLAETSDSIVFGFNVKVEGSAETEAKRAGVDIRLYSIIYEILADVRAALEGLLTPVEVENIKGRALVKSVFSAARFGSVAGCLVQEGKIARGQKARLLREGKVVATGALSSLRRFKDDVREVDKGYECGMALEGVKTYQPNDVIETYIIEYQARRLES